MAYPDLYKDESRILEAQNVKVKSVTFEAVLTTRRLILVDTKKHMVPPQEILLATLKNVDSGENAIRDPTITLSIITNTGTTRQMILTFSKTSGGERKREADEWVRALRQHVSQTIRHPVLPDIPTMDEQIPAPVAEPAPPATEPPRIEIVNTPPQKKRIEISRPMKKIIESEPAVPAPVETTSLPVGSFCNRCGSRVPPESAFCNRCGTPVAKEGDISTAPEQPVSPPPVPDEPSPVPETPPEPAPVVPQITFPAQQPVMKPAEKKERPIEQVIHSIEPLIVDSVPRKHDDAPLKSVPPKAPEPAAAEAEAPAPATDIQWPVISTTTAEPAAPGTPPPALPETLIPPVPAPSSGKGKIITFAVIGIVIIAVIAAIVLFANPLQMMSGGTPSATPVPTIATVATTIPVTTAIPVPTTAVPEITPLPTTAPAALIPQTGVWVRIDYANQFSGSVGTPNALREVSDTGEKFYQISTSTGTVVANIQKDDGSADPLTVDLYKDGKLVIEKSTIAPKGIVEIQESLKPAETQTPKPTTVVTTVIPQETTVPSGTTPANSTASE